MNASKTILLLILLVAVGGAVFFMLDSGGDDAPPVVPSNVVEQESETFTPSEPIQGTTPTPAPRTEVSEPARTRVEIGNAQKDAPQGARGRLITPGGAPAQGVEVFLMEGTGGNLFRHMQLSQKGAQIPPVARTETDANGEFALGVAQTTPGTVYEVRVVCNDFVDHNIPNVHITNDEWFDAGTIQLKRGATVFGRITVKGSSGLPVADASVSIKAVTVFPTLTPTPGREDGLVATVDHTGSYRIENVPEGMINISAVAPGYARIMKANTKINMATANQVDFELPPGVSITGVVIDNDGAPVPSVNIRALSMTAKSPVQNETRSGEQGEFEVIGLIAGNYMLTVTAPGYVRKDLKPVKAGDRQIEVVLDKQGTAKLKVFDKSGKLLRGKYRVSVKKYFPAHKQHGNTIVQPRLAKPDRDGVYEVGGLNPGDYVFQVEASGHAKSFSEPFQVVTGANSPDIEMRLDTGGAIRGVVLDARGKPLSGVTVKTLPNDFDENAFTEMFKGMIPYTITRTQAKTNARGEFELTLLTPGQYQLKFMHPEHFDVKVKDNNVLAGEATTIAQLRMQPGTLVSGTARIDGSPSSQVKVTVSAVGQNNASNPSMFSCEAITDNNGQFVLSKRVPPGRYQVMAARQNQQNPLLAIADFHKTKQEFTLGAGQQQYHIDINISSQ